MKYMDKHVYDFIKANKNLESDLRRLEANEEYTEIDSNVPTLLKNTISLYNTLEQFKNQLDKFKTETYSYYTHILVIKEVVHYVEETLRKEKESINTSYNVIKKQLRYIDRINTPLEGEKTISDITRKVGEELKELLTIKDKVQDEMDKKRTKSFRFGRTVKDVDFQKSYDMLAKGLDPKSLSSYIRIINDSIQDVNKRLNNRSETLKRIKNEKVLKTEMKAEKFHRHEADEVLEMAKKTNDLLQEINSTENVNIDDRLHSELKNAFKYIKKTYLSISNMIEGEFFKGQKEIEDLTNKVKGKLDNFDDKFLKMLKNVSDNKFYISLMVRIRFMYNKINNYNSSEEVDLPLKYKAMALYSSMKGMRNDEDKKRI